MVTATELIDRLDRLGVRLELVGDTIRFHPASLVPMPMLHELRASKKALLQELAARTLQGGVTKAITAGVVTLTCTSRHHEPRFWHESLAVNREGWRVTHCIECGKFIGYRADHYSDNT